MSRQSQVNTFNDGLNKDLNPLLTPNNVMTDCLNGTIITYNGNEFALQNDLGNYKFKHGSLDPGFVPVGIKEHANILYIISYNPISDEVEVGSFPSMKTIYKSDINLGGEKEDSIVLDNNKTWFLYTELSKKSKLVLLSDLTDDHMLNPGDKYILERYYQDIDDKDKAIKQTKIEDAWQNRSVYVFTENNKLYNIDEYINDSFYTENNTYTSDNFKNVNWEIPGWLAVKTDINVMDEFNCYLTNVKYNYDSNTFAWKSTDATIKIQSIWKNKFNNIISDYIVDGNDLSIKYNLGYLIYQYKDGDKIENIDWLNMTDVESNIVWDWRENKVTNYNDIYSVIYSSVKIEDFSNKYIAIVPVLRINNNGISKNTNNENISDENNEVNINDSNIDEDDKFIIYDQFATIIDLSKSDFDKNSVFIGSDIFKYYVGDKSVTINIDVESNSDCDFYYRLLRVPEKTYIGQNINSFEKVYKTWTKLQDFNYSGQNIFDIKFTTEEEYINFKYNDSSESIIPLNKIADGYMDETYIQPKANNGNIVNNTFDKEDVYIIQFHVVPKNIIPINNVVEEGVFKEYVMYCSEVSNMYYRIYDNYCSEEFEFGENEFANAIQRQLKVKNIITNNNVDIKTGEYYIAEYTNTNGESLSKNINPKDNIDVFIDEMSSLIVAEDSNLQEFNKSVNFKYGSLYSWVFPNGVELIMPKNQYGFTGRLWRNVDLKKSNVNITMYDDQYNSHSLSTKDNKKFDLNIGSLSNVYINPEVISKQGPKESNVFTFDKVANPPVSKLENGWWKLNYITFINKETKRNDHINFGKVSPNKNIKFKIKSQNRENIYIETIIGDTNYDLYFENGEWNWKRKGSFIVDDKEIKYEFEMWEELSTALFDVNGQFDVTKGVDDDNNDWKNQSGLVKELRCPNIVLFYNDVENKKGWDKFHKIYEDGWGGFEFEYLYNGYQKYIPSEERWFLATNMSLESKYPSNNISFLISPDVKRWQKDRKYSGYVNEVFATYFLMVENIKYSKLSGLINKYILNFDVNHNQISKIYVNNVEYKINNVTWDYDGLSNIQSPLTYKSVRLYDIQNFISESIFYYEEDVDKYFYNYSNTDFATNIDKYVNKLNNNDDIIKSKNDIYSSPEIHTGDFYLNETYDGMYDLRSLIGLFKYENNRIVLKSDDENFERIISLRHKSDDGGYVRVSKIYDNFYFRE